MTCVPFTAFAGSGSFDINQRGSLSLSLCDVGNNAPIEGAEISLYRFAFVESFDYTVHYKITPDFEKSGVSLDEINSEAVSKKLFDYIQNNEATAIISASDMKGNAEFKNLELGIYLAVQSGGVDGYTNFEPFLISVPMLQDSGWIYNVKAAPKAGAIRLINVSVNKAWRDTGSSSRPESIEVMLFKNAEPYDTVRLSDENNWSYTWSGLESNEEWSVKEINVPKNYKAVYKENNHSFTITNFSKLPQTGQLNWPVPVFSVAGLLCVLAGMSLYLSSGKKER